MAKVQSVSYVGAAKCHVPYFGDEWYLRTVFCEGKRYYAEGTCRRFRSKREAELWLKSHCGELCK